MGFICLECSERLVDSYVLQCNLKENDKFEFSNVDEENVHNSFFDE